MHYMRKQENTKIELSYYAILLIFIYKKYIFQIEIKFGWKEKIGPFSNRTRGGDVGKRLETFSTRQ